MKSNLICLCGFTMIFAAIHAPADPNERIVMVQMASNNIDSIAWDSDTKSLEVANGASKAHFTFNFTNVSSGNVTILGVHPSCGCTTTQLRPLPWTLMPGTNGQIGVTVNIAQKTGTLSKAITVKTDQGSKILFVRIKITPLANFSPISDTKRQNDMEEAAVDRQ